MVSSAMRKTGTNTAHGWIRMADPVLVDHQAPVGGRRLHAEAQEAQGGDEADGVGEAQAELDEQRARDVRQDLADQDLCGAARRGPQTLARSRGPTISRVAPRATRAMRGACATPTASTMQPQRMAQHRDEQQHEHDLREGQQHVEQAHDDVVDGRPRIAGEQPQADAEDHAEDGGGKREADDRAAAAQHPAEDVAADVVGAQPMP